MYKKFRRFQIRFKKAHAPKVRALKRLQAHPVIIPVSTFLFLILVTTITLYIVNGGSPKFKPISSFIVLISHDHTEQVVPTREPTVGVLLKELNININQGDVVEPNQTTPITQDNFHINIYRAVPVEIINGSQVTYTFSAAATPRAIVQQAGINIYPEDEVTTAGVTNFASSQTISKQVTINPATPVNLNVYGTQITTRTHAVTVGQLLIEKNIKLGTGDSVQPSLTTPITPNIQVFLLHQGTKIQTVQQTIPTPVQTIYDNNLTFGTSAVRQQGSPGEELITYEINSSGAQTVIQTVVIQPAIPEIIVEGRAVQIPSDITATMAQAGISSSDYPFVNYIISNESGWCPTKLQGEIGYCPGYVPNYIPSGLGYGLGQATPGDKMAQFGSDWETNPVTQLRWATSYADGRYGSWAAAYYHWSGYHSW